MKKLYTTLLTFLAVASLSVSAQQFPNSNFEGTWSTCTPWTNGNGNKTIGENPANWCISHVMGVTSGMLAGSGKKAMGEKVTGYNGSSSAVKMYNAETGALGINRNVPGYLTIGTTWSTAKGPTTSSHAGGTWGGYTFAYRPDVVQFMYKREYASATTEPCSFIVYLWKGSTSQASVPVTITSGSSNPATATMTNRDRNILGMSTTTGGAVTPSSDFELIGKKIVTQAGTHADWTKYELPIEYTSNNNPTMINVIFSANDYFNTAAPTIGNSLTIDDVKMIYYSRLASLTVNGVSVEGFDSNIYNYSIDAEMPAEDAFAFTTLGNSGSGRASLSLDKSNAVATITVTNVNVGGADEDGAASHTYTIQFKKQSVSYEGTKYDGDLVVTVGESTLPSTASVYIDDNGDGTCTILLPDCKLDLNGDGDLVSLGDIKVENVTMTKSGDTTAYNGYTEGMSLAGGEIIANVSLTGTESNGVISLDIPVEWVGMEGIVIHVTFNGKLDPAGIDDVYMDNSDAPVEYYNIQGMRVDGENLTPGIYVRRQGTDVKKVYVK